MAIACKSIAESNYSYLTRFIMLVRGMAGWLVEQLATQYRYQLTTVFLSWRFTSRYWRHGKHRQHGEPWKHSNMDALTA